MGSGTVAPSPQAVALMAGNPTEWPRLAGECAQRWLDSAEGRGEQLASYTVEAAMAEAHRLLDGLAAWAEVAGIVAGQGDIALALAILARLTDAIQARPCSEWEMYKLGRQLRGIAAICEGGTPSAAPLGGRGLLG